MPFLFVFQYNLQRFVNIKNLLKNTLKFFHANNLFGKAKFQLCKDHQPCTVLCFYFKMYFLLVVQSFFSM